jgi:hypothetical protein
MVNNSIGLLITRSLHHHKHQLRDFFNTHRRYHSLTNVLTAPRDILLYFHCALLYVAVIGLPDSLL